MKKQAENRRAKKLLTIRMDPKQIEIARKIAQRKSIGYQTLMRMWIAEGIEREQDSVTRRKQA
jgi:hypothetical protein